MRDAGGLSYLDLPAEGPHAEALPPLVFLHEGLGCVEMWHSFPGRLRSVIGRPRTLVYSRRGYGQSPPADPSRGIAYLRDEAVTSLPLLLRQLDIHNPILVGHSDGATIALIHAGSGFAVSALVLLAPHVFAEECTVAGVRAATRKFAEGDLAERLGRYHADPEATFRLWSEMWLDPDTRDWSIESLLPSVRAPVLVLQGADDQYGTSAQLDAIRSGCGGTVRALEMPGVGHAPHLEATADSVDVIASWLGDQNIMTFVSE